MFGLLSPPLCYPEKLAVAQSAQGSSKGNVIGVIKRAAFEKLPPGLAASLVAEQQLGHRYTRLAFATFQATPGTEIHLVTHSRRRDREALLSSWHGGQKLHSSRERRNVRR